MRILIDTQAFIWFVENDKQLPVKIKKELEDSGNSIIISIASLWEMVIKMSLDKLQLGCDIEEMIDMIYQNGFEILPILPIHIIKLSKLDYFHRDPFDRIIISQSLSEDIQIVSSDRIFDDYGVRRKWNK
jgi:PIN domain nuclease of toxin-antitoxin system